MASAGGLADPSCSEDSERQRSGADLLCEGCRGREGSRPASTRETAAGVDAAVRVRGLERPLPRLVPGPLRGLGTRQGQSLGSRRWHAAGRGVLVSLAQQRFRKVLGCFEVAISVVH